MAQKPTRSLASIDRGRREANSSTTYIFFPTQILYFFGLSLFFFAFAFIMLLITFASIFLGFLAALAATALPFEDFLVALAATALTSTTGCHNPGKLSMPKSFVYLHTASFHVGRFPCSPMYVRHTSVASPSPFLRLVVVLISVLRPCVERTKEKKERRRTRKRRRRGKRGENLRSKYAGVGQSGSDTAECRREKSDRRGKMFNASIRLIRSALSAFKNCIHHITYVIIPSERSCIKCRT